jgi:hypothetical protein
MSLRTEVKAIKKQLKPKISARFVYNLADINPAIEGMIWIVYNR